MGIFNRLTPEQFEGIGAELDAIRVRVRADLGERDAEYIRTLVKRQRQLEIAGRVMLMIPPAWPLGVAALGTSKILDNMEIGHNVMHGQWDWMNDPEVHSASWEWDTTCPSVQHAAEASANSSNVRTAAEGSSLETLRHMVASGLGLTILPASAAESSLYSSDVLVTRPFAEPSPSRTVALAWRASFPRHKAIDALRAAIKACRV